MRFIKRKLVESIGRGGWRKCKFRRREPFRSMTVSSGEGAEFEAVEVTSLPEELVEKILAMVPFPSIFKARLLSKSWLARFKPISSLHTAEEKRLAKLFQKQVTESSINWDTFCPVCTTVQDRLLYNQAKQKWQVLPPLPLLPNHILRPLYLVPEFSPLLEGAFLYGTVRLNEDQQVREAVFLINILTREWKLLPAHPEANRTRILCIKLVIDTFLETFKVIIFCRVMEGEDDDDQYFAHIYDSKSDIWRSKNFLLDDFVLDIDCVSRAFHNGVLYIMTSNDWDCLLAFNVEKWTLEELRLTCTHDLNIDTTKLVTLDANLVLIVIENNLLHYIRVLKVDLVSLQLLEVARCLPASGLDVINTRNMMMGTGVTQADCVFFNVDSHYDSLIVEYNKRKDDWRANLVEMESYFHSQSDSYFQPGLNPFMVV